ncbi:MAG: hypothetical protein JJ902_05410 [Roseibium sp.]|nr:hypothetical protein [Roseibium sp.]
MSDGLSLQEKQELLKELKGIRWSGAQRVKFNDRDVTYRTEAELKTAIAALENEIAAAQGQKRASIVVASFNSDF